MTADVNGGDVLSPDPAMKVFASEDLLDANPGRPGAPISIPGYPIETASSGIKAPQYFAPGVAGDHGEPIAQFIQVGSYLVPNNLSANAHGNGYTDPNIYIADVIESVQVDGGAFNVREGNHALNLAATYGLRSHLDPFLTLTGDDRDITATAGMSPSTNSWLAMEGSYGNGFLDRLEHRKQFKFNGGPHLPRGRSHPDAVRHRLLRLRLRGGTEADLRIQFRRCRCRLEVEYPDTIDPRQKDQTHTALVALNDVWKLGEHQELQLSGFFRTYNLVALFRLRTGTDPAERVPHRGRRQRSVCEQIHEEHSRCWPGRITSARRRGATIWITTTSTIPPTPYYYGPFVKIDRQQCDHRSGDALYRRGGRAEQVLALLPGLAAR